MHTYVNLHGMHYIIWVWVMMHLGHIVCVILRFVLFFFADGSHSYYWYSNKMTD